MDACWQEIVTTAFEVGVFLECSELVCSVMIKLDEKSSLKNIENFMSLEKAALDINSLLNVLEPVLPSSRRLLDAGLRQYTFAGMKFYLKHKWRFLIFLSKKKVEMSTEALLRKSRIKNCLLNRLCL